MDNVSRDIDIKIIEILLEVSSRVGFVFTSKTKNDKISKLKHKKGPKLTLQVGFVQQQGHLRLSGFI